MNDADLIARLRNAKSAGRNWKLGQEAATALVQAGKELADEPDYMTALDDARRHELVEGAVDAIEPNVTNRTAAYNTWNNLATDERFVKAILAFRAADLRRKLSEQAATIEAVKAQTVGVDDTTAGKWYWVSRVRVIRDILSRSTPTTDAVKLDPEAEVTQ